MTDYLIPDHLVDRLLAHIGDHPQPMALHEELLAHKTAQDATRPPGKYPHVEVHTTDHLHSRVWLDGKEVKGLRSFAVEHAVDAMPTVRLEFVSDNIFLDEETADVTHLSSTAREYRFVPPTPPAQWDDAALEVACRFTQDTESQRRASLQCAVVEAIRRCQPS